MAGRERLICAAAALGEGGVGVRFDVERFGKRVPAFVVRYDGVVHGYLNQCAHVPVELDWAEGMFFDLSGLYLICATHGATYLPENGRCVRGPCNGSGLRKLSVYERDGSVYIAEEESSHGG
ncbi:MAG: Rieske 2Fe-2S domain-containing protein [Betaproteobacteria bacterium]